jgi:hypothetical protein
MVNWTSKFLKPYIKACGYRSICEIGSSRGENVDVLLQLPKISISIIDPCLDSDLSKKYENNDNVTVYKGLSLDVLPKISEQYDCVIIDGDHNWYTVFNELICIEKHGLLKADGVIFMHDTGWPYGRRDMYYLPETIPSEFRQPYARKGIIYGQRELSEKGGDKINYNNALYEGGEKNGVLTAAEDFFKQHKKRYEFLNIMTGHGLGVLYKKNGIKTYIIFIGLFFIKPLLSVINIKRCLSLYLTDRYQMSS